MAPEADGSSPFTHPSCKQPSSPGMTVFHFRSGFAMFCTVPDPQYLSRFTEPPGQTKKSAFKRLWPIKTWVLPGKSPRRKGRSRFVSSVVAQDSRSTDLSFIETHRPIPETDREPGPRGRRGGTELMRSFVFSTEWISFVHFRRWSDDLSLLEGLPLKEYSTRPFPLLVARHLPFVSPLES